MLDPSEELQLDYTGPLPDHSFNQTSILVAIDRYSKYPSAMITRSAGGKIIIFLKLYISQHSVPKSTKTDHYSSFKNTLVQYFCNERNFCQQFCPVRDHRVSGLVERSTQTIKLRLGAVKLSPNFSNINDTLQQIIEDIRVTKNSETGSSPFELQFGRSPNTDLSIVAARPSSCVNIDEQQLGWNLLTAEQRGEQCDSRPRNKVVKKGQPSPSVKPYFGGQSSSVAETPHYKALESLAKSSNH